MVCPPVHYVAAQLTLLVGGDRVGIHTACYVGVLLIAGTSNSTPHTPRLF